MRTKRELIQAIHDTVPVTITKKQIEAVLDTQALVVAHALVAGPAVERLVTIPGVVKLISVVTKAKLARIAINPATGGRIMVPAKPSSTRVRVKLLSKITGKSVRRSSKIAPLHRPTRFERRT
jgi:nucleoid DNA-binding protein